MPKPMMIKVRQSANTYKKSERLMESLKCPKSSLNITEANPFAYSLHAARFVQSGFPEMENGLLDCSEEKTWIA